MVSCHRLPLFAAFTIGDGKMRLVDLHPENSGSQAENTVLEARVIERPFFSVLLLQPVSRVKLHTWLIRVDIHGPAALLREDLRGETEIAADMGRRSYGHAVVP